MPEGPEVETIRRGLEQNIVGQTVARVELKWPGSWAAAPEAAQMVAGAKIAAVDRRGKVLMLKLDNGFALMFHLKMTGQLVLVKAGGQRFAGGHPTPSMGGALPDKSTRVIFELGSGDKLYFNDQRKFGWIKMVPADEVELDGLVARLGPEVLSEQFTADYLEGQLRRHQGAPVKAVILDQSTASGIGNIYADESLHLPRIHPARKCGSLSDDEIKRLWTALRDIMAAGIHHGGTSFSHYVNSLGGTGDYLEHARVFRREGQPCPECGTIIEKIRVAGRGTHICPNCQVRPPA